MVDTQLLILDVDGVYIYIYTLVGALDHFLFSPIVGMMIQSD